jgi:cell division protein FtsZ
LQAAVSRAPTAGRTVTPPPAAHAAPAAAAAARPAERSRFGIGSLINRMAGHTAPEPVAAPRAQPPVTQYDDEPEMGADQERIEIPAFLRRQAN